MSYKELIPQEEYQKIVERDQARADKMYKSVMEGNDKFVKYKNIRPCLNIKEMLETSTSLYADRPAFWEKPTHKEPYKAYTYQDTLTRVNALGTALHSRGLRGANIAVIGENSYAWATAYLSVVCGTGVVVPLDKELSANEIKQLLVTAEVECIFYSKKYSKMMNEIKDSGETSISLYVMHDSKEVELQDFEMRVQMLIDEGQKLIDEGNRDFLDAQIDAEALGILLFTSGTTGFSKGVMLSHRNICAELMIPPTLIKVTPEDKFFSVLPIHHTYEGTCGFLIPLGQGASVAYCEGLRYILDNLAEAKPTMLLAVPLLVENMYSKIWKNAKKSGKENLLRNVIKANKVTKKVGLDLGNIFFKQIRAVFGGNMDQIIVGGAAIDPEVMQGIKDFGINTLQGYGLTECAPICAVNPKFGGKNASAGYIPRDFGGKINDPDPETGIGEICVKGENVMMGYYKNEEASNEVLVDGWFHTGDYGYIDDENFVFITGRKKSVIITKNGKNVFPEELEYFLGRSDLIGESMVWEGDSGRSEDTIIVASIKPNDDELEIRFPEGYTDEDVAKAIWEEVDKVNDELPIFKKIRRVVWRKESFDMTTSKKIRRFVDSNKEGVEI